ncbi:MAG: molybdopterin-dependent oxidoreductase [Deltaproteobacteria bacterium]|nr:molybdopterin-dependent oxidoreductase [Deltaproteobacteria bacterium]
MNPALTRRRFLQGTGAAALVLSLDYLRLPAAADSGGSGSIPLPSDYRGWEDVYRQHWQWDKVTKGTHLRANCAAACSWDVYVKDGIAWREEQAAVYSQTNAGLPDFGPRGCQKGACHSALSYGPARLKYPLKRVGPRGSGQWQRISWEAALNEIADAVIDTIAADGPGAIAYDFGTNIDFGPSSSGELLLFSLLGAPTLDTLSGVGDMPMGAVQTWGLVNVDGTADDWFHSDYIIVWSMNPNYARIPEAHFLWEARYRGAQVVNITPDYNATAIHCDGWLNPRPGTDAALGLAMAQVIVSEQLYDAAYVKEQTDLPLLVRDDSRRFLRQSDVQPGGKDDIFYCWDEASGGAVEVPGSMGHSLQSLRLRTGRFFGVEIRPALTGSYTVPLAGGQLVAVRPVFELLKAQLDSYTPERAAQITGVGPQSIRRVAREFAKARAGLILASFGSCKHYHTDLMQRAMILLLALCGHQGKRGGGLRLSAMWSMFGFESLASGFEMNPLYRLALKFYRPSVRMVEGVMRQVARSERPFQPYALWLWYHAGMAEVAGKAGWSDPSLPRPPQEYLKEALGKGWMPLHLQPDKEPKIFFATAANPLRRWAAPQVAERVLWPKLQLIVSTNFRMSTTALKSDIVLPAAAYYEKRGIKYGQSYLPYIVFGDKAVEPLAEAKSEWEIYGRLAEVIQQRARARGLGPYRGVLGEERDLATLYERWTFNGRFDWRDDVTALEHIVSNSSQTQGLTWSDAAQRGAVRIQDIGLYGPGTAVCSDFEPGQSVYPSQWFVEHKEPWPTLTGRQQFYLDHPWFLEMREALPVHKDPPPAGGRYPLQLSGGHTRWSIHAIWRDQPFMLQLQRGEPVIYMNDEDAAARGLRDHDRARVFNDLGEFEVIVKRSPAVRPGQIISYHAWEPYQFRGWRGHQEVVVSPLKPLHLVGDYGHLSYRMYYASPCYNPRGTAVEVQRVGD